MVENSCSTVSVVVPVHNGGWKFRRCIDALEDCKPAPLEIIVVADGKNDGEWLPAERAELKTIVLERRSGPACARNSGAAAARGDILLFIDADVVVKQDIIERIQALFASSQNLTAVFGSYDDEPFEEDAVSQYRNLLHHFTHQTACPDASTFWGACGAIRRSVFMKMGGFSPLYGEPSIEDIEFGCRLKKEGYAIRLQKDLQVKHLKQWTMVSMLKTDVFQRAIPWTELLLREHCIIRDLNLSLPARLSAVLASLLVLTPLVAPVFAGYILAAVLSSALLCVINGKFYALLFRKRGMLFLLRALPLHWLYFLYSGFSFLFVFFREHFRRLFVARGERGRVSAS